MNIRTFTPIIRIISALQILSATRKEESSKSTVNSKHLYLPQRFENIYRIYAKGINSLWRNLDR